MATDIAARGIDVSGVSHVINFELPNVAEQYVHRIGRTARAGAAGVAISYCSEDERAYLRDFEKLTRQKIEVAPLPTDFIAEAERINKSRVAPAPTSRHERRPQPHRDHRAKAAPALRGRNRRRRSAVASR